MGRARQAGDAELEIGLLGPLEVRARGEPVAVGGPKPRALLAALALEPGHAVSVDRLVETLWPSDPPDSAGHAVQVYVSQLRKALGSSAIARRPSGYELELDRDRVDVHRFARLTAEGRAAREHGETASASTTLREALGLWRGAALADFTYEPFAQTEISRLEELRLVALEERIETDLELGRHADVVAELEALVETQVLRERPRAQLMLALYRCGRQADALAAYRAARETLVDELGIEPGPALRELEAAILRQDPALVLDGAAGAPPGMQFRRLVTVLFVDLVGSLSLAAALDAEALGRVLERYFESVSGALTRHGANVERYAGDAVTAAFGIPVSHEDDALRAARAALDARAAVADLDEQLRHEYGLGIDVRIGFETGEVVASPTPSRRRPVAGEAVGIAAALERAAGAGEILIGEVAARLVDHAAVLEPMGDLEVDGRDEPVRRFRLVDLAPPPSAFAGRLEAPLVGRKKELAALRKELRTAGDTGRARATLVVGPAGVGKSRLLAELTGRAKGVTTLWGRCLSYGDGITYSPVREIVSQAPASEERAAVLAALESEIALPAPEVAVLVRSFCEALAARGSLVLVVDDLHWAEPTFLDLVEQLVDRGRGPYLVVGAAREELDATRPGFLADRENARRIDLDVLSPDETDALVDGLGGAVLESDHRERIVDAAEGNPFFVEQLVALAYEGGLAARGLPETVRAVLAARLDGLGPGERAVLERAAVIGKRFRLDDVAALLDPEAAPTLDAHVAALVAGGFVRPSDGGEHRFRHVLIQEAVYRAAPKRLRAELHERYADRLDAVLPELSDLDEFAGYHLEQAYGLRVELGESDRRTSTLASDAGRRLGEAGVRALKRGDMPATVGLLERALALLPAGEPSRRELACELGIGLRAMGDTERADEVLARAVSESREAGDRRAELRARIEHEYARIPRTSGMTGSALLAAAAEGIPIFEATSDDRSLGRAWLLTGYVQGARFGRHEEREDAAERALVHYRRSGWPTSTCVGEIAHALYDGPTPVPEAIERCEALRAETSDRAGRAYVEVFLGGLVAQRGEIETARQLIASASAAYAELGQVLGVTECQGMLATVELLGGKPGAAAELLEALCAELERRQLYSRLASGAGELARVVYAQDRLDEALRWIDVAESHTAEDDLDARLFWLPVRAKLHARAGRRSEAEEAATAAVELAERTDALNRRALARCDLGEVLTMLDRAADASVAFDRAVELFEQKGNAVGVTQARALQRELALA